jgi:hypothetical protein
VFDNSLYFEDQIYRTPYLIPELAHNELKMREKNLLYIKKRENCMIPSSGGGEGITIEHLTSFFQLLKTLKH